MKFLFKPKYYEGECLSSYIHRVAEANFVTTHEVWRLFLPAGYHYPQASMSPLLDIYPDALFNTDAFEAMLQVPDDTTYKLTFTPVLDKLGISEKAQSRVISGMIEKDRRFCPHCLEENSIYKLIWQIKEIPFCPIHNVSLVSECERCHKSISILPNSLFGKCPYCGFELKNSAAIKYMITKDDIRILRDWSYLLDANKPGIERIKNFSFEQSLALRILYLIETNSTDAIHLNDTSNISSIKQIARESKSNQTFIHLKSVLYWIRKFHISIEDFFKFDVPDNFIERTLSKKTMLSNKFYCIAPWCRSYRKYGSLNRTATSKKTRKDGRVFHYYMYCKECGTEYCINKSKQQLIERGYFISLAWDKVRGLLDKQYSLKQLAEMLNTTVDKVRRSIIFLAANNLTDKDLVPMQLPRHHDERAVDKMANWIKHGMSAKEMRTRLGLSYNEFLFYWFRPDLSICYIERNLNKTKAVKRNFKNEEACFNAIDFLKKNNIRITIKAVSSYLNVCPETLRNWGVLNDIKQAKKAQIVEEHENNRKQLIRTAEKIVKELLENKKEINSEHVYKKIGKNRTVLVRNYPDVTKEISEIIKKGKHLSQIYTS